MTKQPPSEKGYFPGFSIWLCSSAMLTELPTFRLHYINISRVIIACVWLSQSLGSCLFLSHPPITLRLQVVFSHQLKGSRWRECRLPVSLSFPSRAEKAGECYISCCAFSLKSMHKSKKWYPILPDEGISITYSVFLATKSFET